MIAPVVIVALISIYYIAIGVIFAYMNGVPMLAKIIALVVPALRSSSDLCRRDDRCVYTADERDKEWRRR